MIRRIILSGERREFGRAARSHRLGQYFQLFEAFRGSKTTVAVLGKDA
jgi:hypothetical protein